MARKNASSGKDPVVINRKFYQMQNDGEKGELTLYGEIVESQPVDWWTGEAIDGQFIILKDFLSDLEGLKGLKSVDIHLNSIGGDAYSSIAIHNRLRELQKAGTELTCFVDGVAMSGGSLIMCACNTVKVNPSSIVMIHDCWTYVWDAFNAGKLRKMADELDVLDNSQAEIYVRKTGKDMDEIRKMMDEASYLSGREAVELGFADEVLEDAEDPDISVSTDHRTLFVKGHGMRIAALGGIPDSIRTVGEAPTEPETDPEETETVPEEQIEGGTAAVDNITPETSGRNGGVIMTLEEFRAQNPEAAEALLAVAQATATAQAVEQERQRLADIDAVASQVDAETVQAAKYGNPCSAQEMCYRFMQKNAKAGRTFAAETADDVQESGAEQVEAAHAPAEEDKPATDDDLVAAGKAMAAKLLGQNKEV